MKNYFSGRVLATDEDQLAARSYSSLDTVEADNVMEMAMLHFHNLIGAPVNYFGADSADHTFKVDDIVFKALEDPNDGYRSYLGALDYSEQHNSIFFKKSIAVVRIVPFDFTEETRTDDSFYSRREEVGYRLVDASDDHVWLEFGTDHSDDYYPYFIFRHIPKDKTAE
jgi:hypothetical protein